ncbi:monomeric [FeFe] hydrogenase [Tenuifilum thalassicum]|uniref:4Fe-4S dicluster domain-containing protein n=1 Tax=Tenuifilum thalassicum TaxID=2590900 RepID=A0A7D3XUG2_9BACT|nr:monomeric [FeFe] hydrogenase [Tenuifilum thalassicum]QKG79551.1 4Fe-4S dicluster domain-containing protein [Tenuifilum thalassicum]
MAVDNNAMLIRRELITHVARLLIEDQLAEKIDRVPLIMRPRNNSSVRCCIHKDRAVLKYKLMGMLGFNIQDEVDELTPLSDYARQAMNRDETTDIVLTVVDEACSTCQKSSYAVTNFCRGCVARPCMVNCPKNAITFYNGKASIDYDLCVNCGKCMKVCPFNAVVYMPVPCEEACPVGAISKNENGVEQIDFSKCIYCGKCLSNCPFGAIVEKSSLVDIFINKRRGKELIALVAPAIAGQFGVDFPKIVKGFELIGFDYVYEVAHGAETTTNFEAQELKERLEQGDKFMTTSCCPAYTSLVDKHVNELKPFVSHTKTPMYYSAEDVRKKHPDACIIFVSPCPAKRWEVFHNPFVDFALSFEEYGAWLVAAKIDLNAVEPAIISNVPTAEARGFAASGGVTNALKSVANGLDINEMIVNGIDKSVVRQLKSFVKSPTANFVEVMTCEGGCIGGCNVVSNPRVALKQLNKSIGASCMASNKR